MRDQRLDFFRGLALVFIFIDHIRGNIYANFTLQAVGFFDAAEVFVFISGYTVALVFGRRFLDGDALFGAAQVLRRCWTIYVAHVFLLVGFIAQVSWTTHRFDNPMFAEEMGIARFLEEPHVTLVEGLTLRFQPSFMDILPLYIVLLLGFIPFMLLLRLSVWGALGISALGYAAVLAFDISLATYPEGTWFFNPFAWQLLFNVGAALAVARLTGRRLVPEHPRLLWAALLFVAATVILKLTWTLASLGLPVRPLLLRELTPLADKTDLELLRLVQFFAVAWLVARLVPPEADWLQSPLARPILLCGQNSLHIFCLGIFLAFIGHLVLIEVASSILAQTLTVLGGVLTMCAVAYLMTWFKIRSRPPERRPQARLQEA